MRPKGARQALPAMMRWGLTAPVPSSTETSALDGGASQSPFVINLRSGDALDGGWGRLGFAIPEMPGAVINGEAIWVPNVLSDVNLPILSFSRGVSSSR